MKSYRKEKLASVIQKSISDTLLHRMSDPRISSLITVTRVELTGDLLIAKVYLSVLGDEKDENKSLTAIKHAGGHIQKFVASEVSMRQCPSLRFYIDKSVKVAQQTLALLEENRKEMEAREGSLHPEMERPEVENREMEEHREQENPTPEETAGRSQDQDPTYEQERRQP